MHVDAVAEAPRPGPAGPAVQVLQPPVGGAAGRVPSAGTVQSGPVAAPLPAPNAADRD